MYNYRGNRRNTGLWTVMINLPELPIRDAGTGVNDEALPFVFWKGEKQGTHALTQQYHKQLHDLSRSTWKEFIAANCAHKMQKDFQKFLLLFFKLTLLLDM